jgi:hypothetical protein
LRSLHLIKIFSALLELFFFDRLFFTDCFQFLITLLARSLSLLNLIFECLYIILCSLYFVLIKYNMISDSFNFSPNFLRLSFNLNNILLFAINRLFCFVELVNHGVELALQVLLFTAELFSDLTHFLLVPFEVLLSLHFFLGLTLQLFLLLWKNPFIFNVLLE